MKILVTVKRVTDPDMKIEILPDGSGIQLSSMKFKMNPFDEIAIEEALRLRESHGGEVVVVSIGRSESEFEIRTALAMGGDRGIRISVDQEMDSDAVARILTKVVEDERPDIVIMGKQAVDIDDNQVAQLLAAYLGWGQACFASKVDMTGDNSVRVEREVDGGIEVVEMDLPGVVSADLRLNEPRYATLPAILKAKKKQVKTIDVSDFGVDTAPKVVIRKLSEATQRGAGIMVETVADLVNALKNEKKVI